VNCHLALYLRNLAVELQLNNYGAVMNLAQINTSNSRFGQVVKAAVDQAGYFIYPTLRAEQPHIIAQWENAFTKILKEW
jgi:hypothetical protein